MVGGKDGADVMAMCSPEAPCEYCKRFSKAAGVGPAKGSDVTAGRLEYRRNADGSVTFEEGGRLTRMTSTAAVFFFGGRAFEEESKAAAEAEALAERAAAVARLFPKRAITTADVGKRFGQEFVDPLRPDWVWVEMPAESGEVDRGREYTWPPRTQYVLIPPVDQGAARAAL